MAKMWGVRRAGCQAWFKGPGFSDKLNLDATNRKKGGVRRYLGRENCAFDFDQFELKVAVKEPDEDNWI